MKCVVLAGKLTIEIRIAFPKALRVPIIDSRIIIVCCLIDRVPAARQMITIRKRDRRAQFAAGNPIAFMIERVTPRTVWVPMPHVAAELGPQTISQRLEAGGQHRVDVGPPQLQVVRAFFVSIDRRAQRMRWCEAINRMRGVDRDGGRSATLREDRDWLKEKIEADEERR